MSEKLLVAVSIQGSPEKLEHIFSMLQKLGAPKRLQPANFVLETNVTLRGVRSAIRQHLEDGDQLCVVQTTGPIAN